MGYNYRAMASPPRGPKRGGLGALLARQQLKAELNAVLERRRQAIQRLGESVFTLIEDGLMQPYPSSKDAYLDARALDGRVRELKKLIAQGYVGPAPAPARRLPDLLEMDLETRPASAEEGPPGPPQEVAAPAAVRGRLGACVCGAVVPAGAKYCPECGMPAEPPEKTLAPTRHCPHCKAEIPFGAEFCPKCGAHADQEVYEV